VGEATPGGSPGKAPAVGLGTEPWRGPSRGRWARFVALATGIVVADQVTKAIVVGSLAVGEQVDVVGDLVRIVHWRNTGMLFGLLPDTAGAFAIVSVAVVGLIVWYHARAGRGLVVSVALACLLGGAIGNLIDRFRYGAVIDFVDAGLGDWRWYTFNVADAGISTALVLLLALSLVPGLADRWPDD
jgi:signal peptidase II